MVQAVPQVTLRALERSTTYSEELGLTLREATNAVYFKWFLAGLLFGGHISETIARNTYRAFVRHGLTRPRTILAAGWDYLVDPVMREGGYVRYDGRKSMQILRDCKKLEQDYAGSLKQLHRVSVSAADLEARILDFFGVGPITMNIFLRELRPYWCHADPEPLPAVVAQARRLGVDLAAYNRKTVLFSRVEAGLIRVSHLRPPRSGGARPGKTRSRSGGRTTNVHHWN